MNAGKRPTMRELICMAKWLFRGSATVSVGVRGSLPRGIGLVARQDLRKYSAQIFGVPFPSKLARSFCTGCANASGESRVVRKFKEHFRKRRGIGRVVEDQPVDTVLNDFHGTVLARDQSR